MNLPFPAMTASKNPRNGQTSICVNWLRPDHIDSDFVLESLQMGPFEESHPRIMRDISIMILKSSDMEN